LSCRRSSRFALVALVWVALHAYEIIWWRESRARTRALRAPASAS
jgi:hypothetical protein